MGMNHFETNRNNDFTFIFVECIVLGRGFTALYITQSHWNQMLLYSEATDHSDQNPTRKNEELLFQCHNHYEDSFPTQAKSSSPQWYASHRHWVKLSKASLSSDTFMLDKEPALLPLTQNSKHQLPQDFLCALHRTDAESPASLVS